MPFINRYLKFPTLSVILIFFVNIQAASPKEILFVPWGKSAETLAYRSEPAYRFGPQNFQVIDGSVSIIDPLNKRLKIYNSGKLLSQKMIPATTKSFFQLGQFDLQKKNAFQQSGSVTLLDQYTAEIALQHNKIRVQHNNPKLASMRYLGHDSDNRYYVDVNIIVNQLPLIVKREIQILNTQGSLLKKISLPHHYYTKMKEDIQVNMKGYIFHMISSKDGIHIFKWNIDEVIETGADQYPDKFYSRLTFHTHEVQELHLNKISSPIQRTTTISRKKTLEIADTYVQHEWTCSEENLTDGEITAPDGDIILTADWIQIGTNQRVPYKWGGFDLLSVFDNGLENGDYAGDTYTDGNVGSNYARGVDCSGYVSRCWQLPYQVSTRQMDDPAHGAIVQQYNSWNDLKPGDAIHRHGHVILFVKHNANGALSCVEAAASTTDWKVDYTVHYPYGLTEYKPVFYRNMEGVPIPAPQNLTLQTINNTDLKITFSSVDEADHYIVYYGTRPDSLLETTETTTTTAILSELKTNQPYYINVQAKNDISESILSSEIFAAAPSDNPHKILVVNGFDRSTNDTHDYITRLADPITQNGYGFSYVKNELVANQEISLSDFHSVIWILGDESSADETFSSTEQQLVKTYLRQGGNFFVTGSEIGWDLDGKPNHPSVSDKDFYHNFLKASYYTDAPYNQKGKHYTANPIECSIFNKLGSVNFDDGTHGTINVDWPDAIKPINGSTTCMTFNNVSTDNGVAGIEYNGIFPGGKTPGKLVYLTFPVETVYPEQKRTAIISAVMSYFNSPTALDDNPIEILAQYQLHQNYPNPFNPTTTISYQLPEPGFVELTIHDLSGCRVKTLEQSQKSAGHYQSDWLAMEQSSGVYFYTLKVFDTVTRQLRYTKTKKSILLK